jgi:hypothetical protein
VDTVEAEVEVVQLTLRILDKIAEALVMLANKETTKESSKERMALRTVKVEIKLKKAIRTEEAAVMELTPIVKVTKLWMIRELCFRREMVHGT